MTLVDANLLLYAAHSVYPQHRAGRGWLEQRLSGVEPLGLPWASLLAFTRLSVNPRIFECPMPGEVAWQHVQAWLAAPNVFVPVPGDQHCAILADLFSRHPPTPRTVTDCHLAALAIEHALVLATADGGFSRYAGLRWENPLAA